MKYIIQNNNSNYGEEIKKIINQNKEKIFNFFNAKETDLQCTIYIYDSIESLIDGLKNRGFKDFPDYMCACFKDEDNSLNFFEPKDNPSLQEWSKEEYKNVIYHELIHAVQYNLFGYLPEWLSEGIAKYLDGTYSKGVKCLLDNYINNNQIPSQSEIENEFGMHSYDSYDYAYLMVNYLIETLGKNNFIVLLREKIELKVIKENLLNKSINYYNYKYGIKSDLVEENTNNYSRK